MTPQEALSSLTAAFQEYEAALVAERARCAAGARERSYQAIDLTFVGSTHEDKTRLERITQIADLLNEQASMRTTVDLIDAIKPHLGRLRTAINRMSEPYQANQWAEQRNNQQAETRLRESAKHLKVTLEAIP